MINLKKMNYEDISLLVDWFKMDHVRDIWFSIKDLSDEEIRNKYSKRLDEDKIDMYIIKKNQQEIGYIQTYFLENTSNFKILGVSKGIDIFIGEETELGKNYGPIAIQKLIRDEIFKNEKIEFVCIDPEVKNTRAIKAYKKVGFEHSNTTIDNDSKLLTYYMILDRKRFFAKLIDYDIIS